MALLMNIKRNQIANVCSFCVLTRKAAYTLPSQDKKLLLGSIHIQYYLLFSYLIYTQGFQLQVGDIWNNRGGA